VKRGRGGVKYEDMVVGDGPEALRGSTVDIVCDLSLNKGEVIQTRQPWTFRLGERNTIAGLEYGVEGMRPGGVRRLRIGPHFAYREKAVPIGIPPNALLEVRVELLRVRPLEADARETEVLKAIDAAFGSVERPEHFADHRHCCECFEHDALLLSRDRDTLTHDDVGNPGWDPICFASAQGFAYYLPSLARLALRPPDKERGWYGDQLHFHLYSGFRDNKLYAWVNDAQRQAVAAFLAHLIETRADLIQDYSMDDVFLRCHELWSGGSAAS
jgi:hypothetical protein